MKIVEDEVELENTTSSPIEDDFANLIIPNKIYPSKLSKLKSNSTLNKNVSDNNKQESYKKTAKCNDDVGLLMPSTNTQSKSKVTEYRNGVIIEEL